MRTENRALKRGKVVLKYKIGAYVVDRFQMEEMIVPTEMRFHPDIF